MNRLGDICRESPYIGYAYSYPHKTAYRPLDPPVALADAWAGEDRHSLFLYLHVPFCEARCGYCNLFSISQPENGLADRYVRAVCRQAERVRDAIGSARFGQLAIGGGTPTVLSTGQLETLLTTCREVMGAAPGDVLASVEVSPASACPEKLALLRASGISRISIGVETFSNAEARALLRPQKAQSVHAAVQSIRDAGFPVLNIDLIYGGPGQTASSWLDSLRQALIYRPEELYLYPLYVRPTTGLGGQARPWADGRLAAYHHGREFLLANGYAQVSMRMFRRSGSIALRAADYCCQRDGMIGLGCGARSYTTRLHYGWPYAVSRPATGEILEDYVQCDGESFGWAEHGIWLDDEDRRRRWVIKSLLRCEGLSRDGYRETFGTDAMHDLPELEQLAELGLAEADTSRIMLTETGLEFSDAIGPALYSQRVHTLMEGCPCR